MKRRFEDQDEDRINLKRFKADDQLDLEQKIVELPTDILKIIIGYSEAKELALFIISATPVQDLFSDSEWMRLYVQRWKIDQVKSPPKNTLAILEDSIPISARRFVLFNYWHEYSWKIRYKLRSQLGDEVHVSPIKPLLFPNLNPARISFYKIDNDGQEVKYDNLDTIKEENREMYPDAVTDPRQEDDFDTKHVAVEFIAIGQSTIPVKFRVEMQPPIRISKVVRAPKPPVPHPRTQTRRGLAVRRAPIENEYRPAKMRYFSERFMVYNSETKNWHIIAVNYNNFSLEEEERLHYGDFHSVLELVIGREQYKESYLRALTVMDQLREAANIVL